MALVGTQFAELCEALVEAFNLAQFDQMLMATVRIKREVIVTPSVGVGLKEIVSTVIGASETGQWTQKLVRGAHATAPGSPLLQAFIAKYQDFDPSLPLPEPIDCYETMFLVGRKVFLDRKLLRAHLRSVGEGDNSRVIVVTGPRASGKTYSTEFIGYILQFDGRQRALEQKLIYVDLDSLAPIAEAVVRRIGDRLDLERETMPGQEGEQDARWGANLHDWIVDGINNHEADVIWLIFDGFRKQSPSQEVQDLIKRLVQSADSPMVTNKLRIVLINHKPDLLDTFPMEEEIEPEPIQRDHMECFINWVYQQSKKTYSRDHVIQAVQDIERQVDEQIAKYPEEKERRLLHLSVAMARAAQRLAK